MLKTVLSYFFIVFGLVALYMSTSRSAMEFVATHRDSEKWWGAYPCLHGDLVSLSYLDIVERFNPPRDTRPMKNRAKAGGGNTALYLHGDSYSYHLSDTNFAGLAAFYPIDRNHGKKYHLDPAKKNILLIEVSERYIRAYFGGLQMFGEVYDTVPKTASTGLLNAHRGTSGYSASLVSGIGVDKLFNKYINQNLQCNLFNYNLVIPMFEYKAALNYYLFNRASGDVVISNDRNFLFLKETVSKTDIGSSYVPIDAEAINTLVNNFNTIYDHYRAAGFSEVYLSMIPNSATIMQPEGYNNLIPLIQNDTRLRMKIIDAWSAFRASPKVLYQPGDTHWNNDGRELWLDLVNKSIN